MVRVGGVNAEQVRAWVEASCAAQGVPLHLADAVVVERVRVLLTGLSQPPDDLEAGRIQPPGPARPGTHQDVVDDRFDDGCLAGEVQ